VGATPEFRDRRKVSGLGDEFREWGWADNDENKPVWPTWAVSVLSGAGLIIMMRISLFGQLGL
jgi:hypothetical protein